MATQNVQAMDAAVTELAQASELSASSGQVLGDIVDGTEKSAQQIRSIATAAEQQSSTSEEINRSVEEINTLAHNAAHSVEETTASLLRLSEQSVALMELIRELKADAGQA